MAMVLAIFVIFAPILTVMDWVILAFPLTPVRLITVLLQKIPIKWIAIMIILVIHATPVLKIYVVML
jgi:hypothetical protein